MTLLNRLKRAETGLVNVTASTLSVTRRLHAGKTIALNRAAGTAVTLPAASGSGDKYEFVVGTTNSGGSTTILSPNAAGTFIGTALLFQDAGDTAVGFAAVAGTSDTLTLNGTTLGGIAGAKAVVTDVAANVYHVEYVSDASGVEATPFSATVA